MAFTDLGVLASGGSRTANQATFSVFTTAAVAAGELIVAVTSVDVAGLSSGIDASTYDLRIGGTNGTRFLDKRSNQPGTGSQTGTASTMWWLVAPQSYPVGTEVIAKYNSPTESDHSALIVRHFSLSPGMVVDVDSWTSNVQTTAVDPPSLNVSTGDNTACLRIRSVAGKHPTGVSTTYGVTAGWSTFGANISGIAATSPDWEVSAFAEFRVVVSPGGGPYPSDPSLSSPCVQTNIYVALKEVSALDLGNLAYGGSRAVDQASLTATTVTDANAGDLVVVIIAVDNRVADASNGDLSVATVQVGGQSLARVGSSGPATGPQTGPGCQLFWGQLSAAVPYNSNVTVTFVDPTTSDHAAFIARRFRVAGRVTRDTPGTTYRSTAVDYPAMGGGASIVRPVRVRGVAGRFATGVSPSFNPTSGWTTWNVTSSGYSPTPDWEIFAAGESLVLTTVTTATSDPSASTAVVNANVYVEFDATPYTGTFAATEGSDSASFSGTNGPIITGTIEAYEGAVWLTADSTLYTADDNVTRVNTAGQIRDTASFAGNVQNVVTGVLAATDVTDAAAFAGNLRWDVVLAATEGADTSAFAGSVGLIGALVATENADTAAFAGTVAFVANTGTLAAVETTTDTADFQVVVGLITATMAAVEAADTAAFAGEVAWTGTLAATESTSDTASFTVELGAVGGLHAIEARDTPAFEGYLSLVDEKVGVLNAFEDKLGGYSEPRADSTLVTADNTLYHVSIDYYGTDRALFNGEIITNGVIAAIEGADVVNFAGTVPYIGVLAATEAGDEAAFAGTLTLVITGVLAAQEDSDTPLFFGAHSEITGVLAAQEEPDVAYFALATWEQVGDGAGLKNELQRTIWLTGQGGRVTWLENEIEDTDWQENLNPEVVSLVAEQQRITELRP